VHDFAVSREIADLVLEKAREAGASKVVEVVLRVGEFSHLSPEQLHYWLEQLFEGTLAENSNINIELIGGTIRCTACGHQQKREGQTDESNSPFSILAEYCCKRCGATMCEIISGKECILHQIQIQQAS